MKKLNYFLFFFVLTSLISCEPSVTFNEPQPADTKNLSIFPKRIQGKYLSLLDSSKMLISDNLVQRIYDLDYKIHINQLDSSLYLSNDTLINLKTNERTIIIRNGDSLINHIHGIDTLFQLTQDNVLKKYKGYYFLNIRYGKDSWEVSKVNLSKGQLIISKISTKLDLDNLKKITEMPQDTISPYKFKATKKQFKEFIKNHGFSDSEIFVRQ